MGGSGTVSLSVDGARAGSGTFEKTTPFKDSPSENQDIGTDTGTPVTYDDRTPLDFEDDLEELVVEMTE
jgi:arylsulfatase